MKKTITFLALVFVITLTSNLFSQPKNYLKENKDSITSNVTYSIAYPITYIPTTIKDGKRNWKEEEFEDFFDQVRELRLPKKSKYETIAEYKTKIDSIKNSTLYKEILKDTFVFRLEIISLVDIFCIRKYDAEKKIYTLQVPSAFIKPFQQNDNYRKFYIENGFLKDRYTNGKKNYINVCVFPLIADIAKKEENFDFKIYFCLSISNMDARIPDDFDLINIKMQKIELMNNKDIIFTITKDTPTQNYSEKQYKKYLKEFVKEFTENESVIRNGRIIRK